MDKIITTNVRIPAGELLTYRELALSQGKSFSQLVRDILAKAIIYSPEKIKRPAKKRSFWDIDNFAIKSGDAKASQKINKYVYDL